MRGSRVVVTIAAAASLAAVCASADAPAPARQTEILQMLFQDCGACHGLTLRGGLGPALTAQALDGKSAESLRAALANGRPNTPMPPWRPFLSDGEITWLVEQMRSGVSNAR